MAQHDYHDCKRDGCSPDEERCNFCRGGLSACVICLGAEGALPTECPGEKMSMGQIEDVYSGKVDFVNGSWGTPA